MEPLRGGQLTRRPPDTIAAMFAGAAVKRSQADWALQWIWSQPEVAVILSGMSVIAHVQENVESAEKATIGTLTDEELQLIDGVRREYLKTTPISCTSCKYCIPCPEGVHIFQIFELYNDGQRYKDGVRPRMVYQNFLGGKQADACVECNECEEVCPQEIPIIDWLKTAHSWMISEK